MWITRVSIANPVFATMVMVALCVLGLASYLRLGVEQMPDVSPPVAFVDVAYPGASPEAVERELTKLDRGGAQQHRRRQAHHLAQLRGPQPDQRRVQPERRHGQGDAGRSRPHRGRAGRLPEGREDADHRALRQRQQPARRHDGAGVGDAQRARAVDPRRADRRQAAAERRGRGAGARSAAWPRARCASTSTRRGCAPTRSRRPRSRARCAPPTPTSRSACCPTRRRTRSCASRAACATRSSSPRVVVANRGGLRVDAGRPRPDRRARARARHRGAHQRPARGELQRLQAAGRQHRRHRRGGEGEDGGDPQGPADGRRTAPDLCVERLRQGLAAGPAAHAGRGRAADGGDRVPVPALLALDGHHRADAADLGDLELHRRLCLRLHAELHDDDGA